MQLDFRAPGRELPLSQLLERAVPAGDVERLLRAAAVTVEGLRAPSPESPIPAGTRVRVDGADGTSDPALGLSAADGWRVLVPAVPWSSGEFEGSRRLPGALRFERRETREGLSELWLRGQALSPSRVMAGLASFGHPVVGDLRRGGIAIEGGLRLVPMGQPEASTPQCLVWWPKEPALLGAGTPRFEISKATLRALERQHAWVLPDSDSDDVARFAAGALVRLGVRGGPETDLFARVEDGGRVAARVWSRGAEKSRSNGADLRVERALAKREALLRPSPNSPVTDAYRLIHGEADGLPGLSIDRLGPLLRVCLTGRAAEQIAERALDGVIRSLSDLLGSDPPVVEVVHLRERPAGRLACVRTLRGELPPEDPALPAEERGRVFVRERGIAYWVDPGSSRPEKPSPGVGLYLDQRENRARLGRHARGGGRWLNLFAHTGAFSLALLEAGADEVISVDLSARVLRWLEANLDLNPGIDAQRHRSKCADGRHYLDSGVDLFDGIVLDPPTAAAGGRGYWKLERDLPPLLRASLARLAPGGTLFVSRNDRGRRQSAAELVGAAAEAAGVAIEKLESAPPGPDFPRLRGFPEGDSFDAAIVRRRR